MEIGVGTANKRLAIINYYTINVRSKVNHSSLSNWSNRYSITILDCMT